MTSKSGWVAGINHGSHDSAAVLLYFGVPKVWVEQERLSRTKHAVQESPAAALDVCLKQCGVSLADLDGVALGSDHDVLADWLGLPPGDRTSVLPYDNPEWLFPSSVFGDLARPEPVNISHHLAHAASTHCVSGFERSAILVADAMGERTSVTIAHGQGRSIEILEEFGVEDSLGFYYEAACKFVGFNRHQAGKLMGLAAYGAPVYEMPIGPEGVKDAHIWRRRTYAARTGREGICEREADLLAYFESHTYPYAVGCGGEVMAYKDFAASAQKALQDCMIELARRACEVTDCRNLTLAGGVALNCTTNGHIAQAPFVDGLFVQPVSTDAGVALGAGLLLSNCLYGAKAGHFRMDHAYLGPELSETATALALDEAGLPYRRLGEDAIIEAVADLIADHKTVAWHQGRPEVGPRALGARSLLGNPTRRCTLIQLNRIKSREVWRPLAPSVLVEAFQTYFDGTPNPFMIVAARVKAEAQRMLPAVTHVDGSARPQAVCDKTSPRYAKLLRAVGQRTGHPVVVNTSLNGPNEPICFSVQDSIRFFQETEVDALAIGDHLVLRDDG